MRRLVKLFACAAFTASIAYAQTLPGPAFPISDENLDPEMQLVAAGARSSIAVAWQDLATNLRIRFLRADGVPLAGSVMIGSADDVSLASDGSTFLLVYSNLQQVRAIRYSAAGERLDINPLIVSTTASDSPRVDAEATGRGTWRIFWSEGAAVHTATMNGTGISEPSVVVMHADPLVDIQAQLHPVTGIWLITVTTEPPCRITCVPFFSSTVYATLLPGTAVDIGELEGEMHVPEIHVLRDGRIAGAANLGAIGWKFEGSELVPQWAIEHDATVCESSLVEHGSETLLLTIGCQGDVLFLQPVTARGAVGVRVPLDAAVDGYPIATFRTLRGAGVVYVADPSSPTLVGRVMPSLYRRGVIRP